MFYACSIAGLLFSCTQLIQATSAMQILSLQCTCTRICIGARRPSNLVTFHSHEYDWYWLELFRLGLGAGTCCVQYYIGQPCSWRNYGMQALSCGHDFYCIMRNYHPPVGRVWRSSICTRPWCCTERWRSTNIRSEAPYFYCGPGVGDSVINVQRKLPTLRLSMHSRCSFPFFTPEDRPTLRHWYIRLTEYIEKWISSKHSFSFRWWSCETGRSGSPAKP